MSDYDVPRFCGYSYADIKRLERERDRYRFALREIVFGAFNRKPPRDKRTAQRIALRALMKKVDR